MIRNEKVLSYEEDGLDALLYTSQGDMRAAINNLQATVVGFGYINAENVYQVVDVPHPMVAASIIEFAAQRDLRSAIDAIRGLSECGYSAIDIVTSLIKSIQIMEIEQKLKLALIKEIGETHLRISEGLGSILQLTGLVSRLCLLSESIHKL